MVLIIDNYDSFTYNLVHLVARVTTEIEVYRNDVLSIEEIQHMQPDAILISPGPGRPADAGISEAIIHTFGRQIPILGVCLGHQAIGEVFGCSIVHAPELMHGKTSAIYHDGQGVYEGMPQGFRATRYHSLVIDRETLPEVLQVTAETEDGVIMGVRHRMWPVEGVQFHPESIMTEGGHRIVKNWLEKAHVTL